MPRLQEGVDQGDKSHIKNQLLWVDDNPDNYIKRHAFEALGLRFSVALSTKEALEKISQQQYSAIISDMGRKEDIMKLRTMTRYASRETRHSFLLCGIRDAQTLKGRLWRTVGKDAQIERRNYSKMVTRALMWG